MDRAHPAGPAGLVPAAVGAGLEGMEDVGDLPSGPAESGRLGQYWFQGDTSQVGGGVMLQAPGQVLELGILGLAALACGQLLPFRL